MKIQIKLITIPLNLTQKCVDNDNLLSNQENKSIIIKAISDEGLSKSKPCFGFHRYN